MIYKFLVDKPAVLVLSCTVFAVGANRASNVCPCVPRRTLSRDESIVLESQIFSWQVHEVIINMSLSLTISP
jgi:hypothetical protein